MMTKSQPIEKRLRDFQVSTTLTNLRLRQANGPLFQQKSANWLMIFWATVTAQALTP
jgi:hypothetical protein